MTRPMVVVTFVAAELWQLFFGAFSSLQLGAPGVGDRASWVPNVLLPRRTPSCRSASSCVSGGHGGDACSLRPARARALSWRSPRSSP